MRLIVLDGVGFRGLIRFERGFLVLNPGHSMQYWMLEEGGYSSNFIVFSTDFISLLTEFEYCSVLGRAIG
jgi:hypothetical protein